jgi:signal transduction histidine kinase
VTDQVRAAQRSIASLLAQADQLTDVLPALHQRALESSGGTRSLLFEVSPHRSRLHATSGFGLETLDPGPWTPAPSERYVADDAFARGPVFIENAAQRTPDLSARLASPSVCLIPLVCGRRRCGLLAIGFDADTATPSSVDLAAVADDFVLALELFRLHRQEDLHHDVRALLDEFSATVSATLDVTTGLEIICRRARRLFGADRTSVWIHDRGARHLELRASSDREHLSTSARVSAEDLLAPAAAAMRRSRASAIAGEASTWTVAVPLRGYRRALGALVFDGVRMEPAGESHLLDRADEVGRQLSSALDSLQLIEEVGRSRAELASLFDAMPLFIAVTDQRGRLAHANSRFAERLKTTAPRLRGRLLVECLGEELASWIGSSAPVVGRSGTAACEMTDPVLGGPLSITVAGRLDREGQPSGLLLVARELSEHPQPSFSADFATGTEPPNLAALGQFIAGLAHELNNPLQGVLGHLDLLRATHTLPKSLRPSIRTIYREADRASQIVRSLLMFAGSRRAISRPVSLRGVLQKVVLLRQAECRAENIEIVKQYPGRLPRANGDPLLLHQVFLNVFTNAEQAIKATGRPGRIEIAVQSNEVSVTVTIRDTGPGIPAETLPRMFEPFYTTKEVGQGTGLGLAIVYGIVQDHGGRITAANHPEAGAVLTVELPAVPMRPVGAS